MADHKMKEPEKGKKPELITTPGKPGDSGPGGAHPGKNPPKSGAAKNAAKAMKENELGTFRSR